jgi:hypothetical protein
VKIENRAWRIEDGKVRYGLGKTRVLPPDTDCETVQNSAAKEQRVGRMKINFLPNQPKSLAFPAAFEQVG